MGYGITERELKQVLFILFFIVSFVCIPSRSFGQGILRFSPVIQTDSSPQVNDTAVFTNAQLTVTVDSLWTAPSLGINPSTAMYHSLLFPGWGQINNGKKKKAALFFLAEMVCIGGIFYITNELNSGDYEGYEKDNLRTNRNTYILSWMAVKVFGIVDAYVDAQFADYDIADITPKELLQE